jgi:DNA-binding transcriptional ArsR family regulator
VLRFHFIAQDMARVRMRATLGPLAETLFALDLFARGGSVAFNGWRRQVRHRLGRRAEVVEQLTRSCRTMPNLLWLLDRSRLDLGDHRRRQIMAALMEFRHAAVEPYWSRVQSHLEDERDARGRIVIAKGVEHLLSTLHPKLRWRAPILEIPGGDDVDIHLAGRGLQLFPSFFLCDKPCVLDADRAGPPTLAFPIPVTTATVAALCSAPEANDQALSALVGHTRAAALQALTDSCTTSELAQRLNISSAGASQHASILREAGLITTCRNRNTVLHALTSLGVALLRNHDALARPSAG